MRSRFRRGQPPYFPLRRPTSIPKSKTFVRDVLLLDLNEPDIIPRGVKKMVLQEEGRIANMVELDVLWDEQKVSTVIEGRFHGLVNTTQPFPRYI